MKRILLISHNALSQHENNGKTLASIFRNWDPECWAQIYFNNELPESTWFKKFFRVCDVDVVRKLASLGKIRECGRVVFPRTTLETTREQVNALESRLIAALKRYESVKLLLRDAIFGTGGWSSPNLTKWIAEFRPDSVFFVGGNSAFSFYVARTIARSCGVPLDIYITDDYVQHARPTGWVGRMLLDRLRKVYRDAFEEARYVFVIGDDMACSFSTVFSRTFIPVMNSVVMGEGMAPREAALTNSRNVDFVYAGGLHLGRDQSLVAFGRLLRTVSADLGLNARLSVYSIHPPSRALGKQFSENGIHFGGSLAEAEVKERLEQADFVLHVESFEGKYISKTKLSVSTKIPEYLASGACLVAFGPSEVASIRLIEKNSVGVALSERNTPMDMRRRLISVIQSPALRQELAVRGYRFAKTRFDGSVVRRKIESCLNQ